MRGIWQARPICIDHDQVMQSRRIKAAFCTWDAAVSATRWALDNFSGGKLKASSF